MKRALARPRTRTSLLFDAADLARARHRARELGVSFAQLVRTAVRDLLDARGKAKRRVGGDPRDDPLFDPVPLPDDIDASTVPRDGAENHDKYFADAWLRKRKKGR